MTRVGRLFAGVLVAGATAGTVLLAGTAHSAVVRTQISLADFKKAHGLSSVRVVLNRPTSGPIDFWIVKRDKFGNKIDFSDPNHAKVDESKSFIVFRTDSANASPVIDELMQVRVITKGPPSETKTLDLNLGGTNTEGVTLVTGGGVVVSPS